MLDIPTAWCGSHPLIRKSSRGHLASGHAIDSVVDKNGGDLFSTVGGMDDLSRSDGSEITITLVGKDGFVRMHPFDAGGDGWSSSVGRFNHIDIEIVVTENGAANRCTTYGTAQQVEFDQGFGHKFMDNSMGATRAVVGLLIGQPF